MATKPLTEQFAGRPPIEIEEERVRSYLSGKNVLVTGAAGSIGSRLAQIIASQNLARLILLDQSETEMFWLQYQFREIKKQFPQLEVVFIIGDICDRSKMEWLFETYRPDIVFHTAAYKHVPLMQGNPEEAVKNNIFGTHILADIAVKNRIDKFIAVSTDKTVNPTSMMGATKRITEFICRRSNGTGRTKFACLRFVNVLDSRGSVLEIWRRQIGAMTKVTVSTENSARYFMSISGACLLLLQVCVMAKGGEIFVADRGDLIRILDIAVELIRRAGYEPGLDAHGLPYGNIEIEFTGLRPGEKEVEEGSTRGEKLTDFPGLSVAAVPIISDKFLLECLEDMENILKQKKYAELFGIVKKLVPEFQHNV